MSDHAALRSSIERAIDSVLDPCSRFNGTNLSFLELGMVDAIEIADDGRVLVRLLLDDPTCMYLFEIFHEVETAVRAVPGVTDVTMDLRGDTLWTEARMTAAARERLTTQRRERAATCGGPQQLLQIAPLS